MDEWEQVWVQGFFLVYISLYIVIICELCEGLPNQNLKKKDIREENYSNYQEVTVFEK